MKRAEQGSTVTDSYIGTLDNGGYSSAPKNRSQSAWCSQGALTNAIDCIFVD